MSTRGEIVGLVEMLKFLIKRCVWDIFFTGEALPNYTEPSSGDLTLLDFSV